MIYIGHFFHINNQQEPLEEKRRHGMFNLIVESGDQESALELFRTRIDEFQRISDMFEGECRIFLVRLLQMETVPREEAFMFNYKSFAGDPIMPFIGCSNPSDRNDNCEIFSWNRNEPEIEGRNGLLFMEFGIEEEEAAS